MAKNGYARLTRPFVRKDGVLVPASWNQALDQAAVGFAKYQGEKATQAFGVFSCSKATNEVNFLAQKFTRQVMGSHNIDSCNRT